MRVHLIDGTYELFRHFFAVPPAQDEGGQERGAVIGVVSSILGMIEDGATHLGVATDHVVESFRNLLWPGYKTGEGMEPTLWAQFHPLEETLRAMGVETWGMVELEADDGLAAAAHLAAQDGRVEQILICTPDKDLAQCVVGKRIVQFDRRRREVRDEAGVVAKFGVPPASIPDWLALVGDSADGYPGIPGWGAKSAATVLARYLHLEAIPAQVGDWDLSVRGAARLSANLEADRERVMLFRQLATLRTDARLFDSVDAIRWRGPGPEFQALSRHLGQPGLFDRARRAAERRA